MRDTFLFDLDGTLLPMDFNKFMELYFYNLGVHFYSKIEPKLLANFIIDSTSIIANSNTGETNEDKFMNHFATLIEGDIIEYKNHFNVFYDTLFKNVKVATYQSKEMIDCIKILKEKGYTVVIATNPLFPMKANLQRIQWAGLDKDDFEYVSSFEVNKFCKPHLAYYNEVLESINKKPEQCYMIGNDVSDDLPAGKLGIETYLITDCLVNSKRLPIAADYIGSYKDFYDFVVKLEYLNTTG